MALIVCNNCFKSTADGIQLMRCGRCKCAHYCSVECQKNDYPIHKPNCLQMVKDNIEVTNCVDEKGIDYAFSWRFSDGLVSSFLKNNKDFARILCIYFHEDVYEFYFLPKKLLNVEHRAIEEQSSDIRHFILALDNNVTKHTNCALLSKKLKQSDFDAPFPNENVKKGIAGFKVTKQFSMNEIDINMTKVMEWFYIA